MRRLFEKYANAPQPVKRLIAFLIIAALVGLLAFYMYQGKKAHPVKKREEVKFEEVVPEVRLLQKSLYEETRKKTEKMRKYILELRAQVESLKRELSEERKKQNEKLQRELSEMKNLIEQMKKEREREKAVVHHREKKKAPSFIPQQAPSTKRAPAGKPEWVGGILVERAEVKKKHPERKERKRKEEHLSVYLPPSFVPADLLNGFAAYSSEKGMKQPVRALFRLRDLAILPNEVKADLRGCFVIGEARGDLSDERAHVRLLRLSCIARDGSGVIDSPVRGWVVDEDGKAGLRGIVVTKMGAFLTRYMLAGFLQGFGEAYSTSQYYTTYSSSSGVVTLPSPGEAAKAGIGRGISKAGKGLADFYLELAKQTLPVIEVGAGKRVTIVFTEGKKLEIKIECLEGRNGCRKKGDIFGLLAHLL